MKCSHPVIYTNKNGEDYCHICGEIIQKPAVNVPNSADKPPVDESTGKSTRKTRTAKTGK